MLAGADPRHFLPHGSCLLPRPRSHLSGAMPRSRPTCFRGPTCEVLLHSYLLLYALPAAEVPAQGPVCEVLLHSYLLLNAPPVLSSIWSQCFGLLFPLLHLATPLLHVYTYPLPEVALAGGRGQGPAATYHCLPTFQGLTCRGQCRGQGSPATHLQRPTPFCCFRSCQAQPCQAL